MAPPAVRDATAYYSRQAFGVTAHRFATDGVALWRSFSDDPDSVTPSLSAPVLSQDHCLFTTLQGELVAVNLRARGQGLDAFPADVFRFATPHASVITSTPAIANGRVYFGGDDGYLYGLGRGASIALRKEPPSIHQRRSQVVPAGAEVCVAIGLRGATKRQFRRRRRVDPPFTLRWAAPSGGLFKQPVCATEEDVVYVTLGGLVVCREQSTGRIRWRRKLPKQAWCRSALLSADEKIYVPRMFSLRYPKSLGQASAMYCLDGQTGSILWEAPMGIGDRLRASPVFADGVVAFGSLYQEGEPPTFHRGSEAVGQAIDAWDANTGRHLWRVKFNSSGTCLNGPAGCVGDEVMYFTGGGEMHDATGETIALVPRTGKILSAQPEGVRQSNRSLRFRATESICPGPTNDRWPACPRPMAASCGNTTKGARAGTSTRCRWVTTTSP